MIKEKQNRNRAGKIINNQLRVGLAGFCLLFMINCSLFNQNEYRIATQGDFDKYCLANFEPGDVILFKRGSRFSGMFSPRGSGTRQAPIIIGTYGNGDRPRIDALGENIAGFLLQDPSFWEVNGLEITNTNGKNEDQGELFGIYVLASEKEGVYEHLYINDCFIHEINGHVAGKRRGGIHVHIKELEHSKFHDLRITNNRLVRIGGVGIGNTSSCGRIEINKDEIVPHNLWTKVYVADNYLDHTGRNSIIARVGKNAIYERNILANSSRHSTGHSIFCFSSDGAKIQYNEAYGNVGGGGHDRGGFDADYNCVNTYIQYNYSHDNEWFCGIMKRPNQTVVIRYNVSQNDRQGIYFYGFEKETDASNIHIYNNTHYVSKDWNVKVFAEDRTPVNTVFENNIFYFEGKGSWGANAKGMNTCFHNNLYFNIDPHESETKDVIGDPLFCDPGQAGTDIDLRTMEALRGYRLKPGSPANDKGIYIEDNGGQDLLKTELEKGSIDIGAVESNQ